MLPSGHLALMLPHRLDRARDEAATLAALPYSAALAAEGARALELAWGQLRVAVAAGDVLLGLPHAMLELSALLQRKHVLSDESRRQLILDIFDVATLEPLPPRYRQQACGLLTHLLRRGKHLTGLQLPWRPLWRLLLAHHLPVDGPASFSSRSASRAHRTELARAAAQCRRHFPEAAAAELLSEAAPLLCPHDPDRFLLAAAALVLLLPSHGGSAGAWLPHVLQLWLEQGVEGSAQYDGLWLGLLARLAKDEFYGLAHRVEWTPLLPTVHSRCLRLLRLPGGHEPSPQLRPGMARPSWEILSAFEVHSGSEAARLVARLLVLTLPPIPAGETAPAAPGFFHDETEAASWREAQLASAADEEEAAADAGTAGAAAWLQLRQLLRCVEPYCHPSNAGNWCNEVGYFVQGMAQFSWWRVLVEARRAEGALPPGAAPPPSAGPPAPPPATSPPLGARDVWALCTALEPLLTQARYSKSGLLAKCADSACKYLTRLAPALLLPIMEQGVAEGLLAVTAVHQTSVALASLATLTPVVLGIWPDPRLPVPLLPPGGIPSAPALAALADGPRAARSLLELMLPGLDANDPRKMMLSLHAIDQLLLAAPMCAPGSPMTDEPWAPGGIAEDVFGRGARVDAEAEAELGSGAAVLAAWLPDFAREALRRMLDMLEHQERVAKGGGSFAQRVMLVQWRATAALFWAQLSPALFDELLGSVLALLPRSSLIHASKHVGAHLAAAVLARPEPAIHRTLPAFFSLLLCPGGKLRALSEGELVWLLKLLAQAVRCGGPALLPHVPNLRALLSAVAAHASEAGLRKVGKAGYKVQRRLLQSLVSTYPSDLRSLPRRLRTHPAAAARPWEGWGWVPLAGEDSSLEIEWHVPNSAQAAAAAEIVSDALGRAEGVCVRAEQGALVSEVDVRAALLDVRAVAKGAMPWVADGREEGEGVRLEGGGEGFAREGAAAMADLSHMEWSVPSGVDGAPPLRAVLPLAGRLFLPGARDRAATVVSRLGPHLASREASKSLLQLLRVCNVLLSDRSATLLGLPQQMVSAVRSPTELRGAGTYLVMPRALHVLRLASRHSDRLAAATFGAAERCPALAPLLELQLRLCTHRYARVRKLAQEGYASSISQHPWLLRPHLLPVVSNLHNAAAPPHAVKATAFLLGHPAMAPRVAADPPLLAAVLAALAKSRDHGLPSIALRLRQAHAELLRHIRPPAPFELAPGGDCAEREALRMVYARAAAAHAEARRVAYAELLARAAADVASPLLEGGPADTAGGGGGVIDTAGGGAMADTAGGSGAGGDGGVIDTAGGGAMADTAGGDGATHWSHEVSALSALLVLPACSAAEREGAALVATRALCSPTKAVRHLGRAILHTLLRPADETGPGSTRARLGRVGAAPELLECDDAGDADADDLWEDVAAGWCGAGDGGSAQPAGAGAALPPAPLGAGADALLLGETHLSRALEWLVTDHRETDEAAAPLGASGILPHEIVISAVTSGRAWPYTSILPSAAANFSMLAARLFERLARHYGPALRPRLLPAALALLAPGTKRDSLAVGLEALGGLLRGSARWPARDRRSLEADAAPAMAASLRACAVESLGDWQACLRFIACGRDPRRLGWLARLLLGGLDSAAVAHETSLAHANALRHLAPLLAELSWRGAPLIEAVLNAPHTRAAVCSGARQVREEVAATLALAMAAAHPPPLGHPHLARRIDAAVGSFVQHVVACCAVGPNGALPLEPDDAADRAAARAARVVALGCMRHAMMSCRPQALLPHAHALMPVALATAACVGEPDLANAGRACAVLLSQAPVPELGHLGPTLAMITGLAASPSWHLRGCLLPPLKYLAYLGQFAARDPPHSQAVRALLLQLLADPQLEVREAALPVLAGFVRLCGPAERRRLLAWSDKALRARALPERHAAVLALSALVALAPYDVPAWLPEVLDRLGRFANEPQPLKAAVSRTFAEFKRTHQDNWAAHKLRLTLEQQEMLADAAVAPHWYA